MPMFVLRVKVQYTIKVCTMHKVVICLMLLTLGPSSKKFKVMSQVQPSNSELGNKGTNIYDML